MDELARERLSVGTAKLLGDPTTHATGSSLTADPIGPAQRMPGGRWRSRGRGLCPSAAERMGLRLGVPYRLGGLSHIVGLAKYGGDLLRRTFVEDRAVAARVRGA